MESTTTKSMVGLKMPPKKALGLHTVNNEFVRLSQTYYTILAHESWKSDQLPIGLRPKAKTISVLNDL